MRSTRQQSRHGSRRQSAGAQPTTDWNLQTEPWVFVVGADGKVTDRFEGSASPAELRQAIQADLG
jgi:glutathione peroxidase-family protein